MRRPENGCAACRSTRPNWWFEGGGWVCAAEAAARPARAAGQSRESASKACADIARYIDWYTHERGHSSHAGRILGEVYLVRRPKLQETAKRENRCCAPGSPSGRSFVASGARRERQLCTSSKSPLHRSRGGSLFKPTGPPPVKPPCCDFAFSGHLQKQSATTNGQSFALTSWTTGSKRQNNTTAST